MPSFVFSLQGKGKKHHALIDYVLCIAFVDLEIDPVCYYVGSSCQHIPLRVHQSKAYLFSSSEYRTQENSEIMVESPIFQGLHEYFPQLIFSV